VPEREQVWEARLVVLDKPELRGLELSEDNVESLLDMFNDGTTRWYATRRARGFATAGLLAGSYWNPDLHPRGPDGKFIETGGFIRWLLDGIWQRGRVENILPSGKLIVAPDDEKLGANVIIPTNQAYGLPTPKGTIHSTPDPQSDVEMDNWIKSGAQGGSNPGGFYTTTETEKLAVDPTSDYVTEVAESFGDDLSFIDYPNQSLAFKSAMGTPQYFVATYTDKAGNQEVIYGNGGSGYQQGVNPAWDEARNAADLKVWVTTDPAVQEAARLALEHEDIAPGTQFYIKRTKSLDHGANEMLANELYKVAGVPVPDLYFGQHQTVASKILKSATPEGTVVPLSKALDDPDVIRQIRENMVVDAWLANWDVAGMTHDNIMVVDGVPYRIDTGGSLQYRAQGAPKGSQFGRVVGEVDSYLNSSINPSSSQVFAGITLNEQKMGAQRVAAIRPSQIKNMVSGAGLDPDVADILIARRDYLLEKYGVADPFASYTPPKLITVGKGNVSSQMFWNPISNQWEPGTINFTPSNLINKMEAELATLWQNSDPELSPVLGDTVVAYPGGGRIGLFRVTGVDMTGNLQMVSAVDPDNHTVYMDTTVPGSHYSPRVVEPTESFNQLHTQYEVAQTNNQLVGHSLWNLFNLTITNEGSDKPPLALQPQALVSKDIFTDAKTGDFLFHRYPDPEKPGTQHDVVYRIDGISESSIAMTSMLDGKERFISRPEWENEDVEIKAQWHIPDPFTQDQTLGMMLRDDLITADDTATSTEFSGGEPEDTDLAEELDQPTAWNTTPYTPADLAALGVSPTYTDPTTGVNAHVQIGESVGLDSIYEDFVASLQGLPPIEDAGTHHNETSLNEWVGQSIILSNPANPEHSSTGLFYVKSAAFDVKKSYYGDKTIIGNLYLISPTGENKTLAISTQASQTSFRLQTATTLDASIPQTIPTFKKNGDIIYEGVLVGHHATGYGNYAATILPEFTINGAKTTITSSRQRDLRKNIGKNIIPQLQPTVVEKSEAVKKSKDTILSKASFKTRKDFTPGSWVAAPDGFTGKVWEGTDDALAQFPQAVRIYGADGKSRIINANLLVSIDEPSVPTPVPVGDVVITDAPFWPLKLKDGNDPRIGQYVRAFGPGDKITEGTINWVGPPDGKQAKVAPLLAITTDEGKVIRKTLSKTILLKDVDGAPVPSATTEEGLPESAKASVEMAIDFTETQISDAAIKYVTPDGKTLAQPQWERDNWLSGSPYRTLTKDGFAPKVGMRVRTTDDQAAVIVMEDDVFKKPNYVRVYNFAKSDYEYRVVSRLWVDHYAELNGPDPIEYVSKVTSAENIVQLPNGTVIYKAVGEGKLSTDAGVRKTDMFFYINNDGRVVSLPDSHVKSGWHGEQGEFLGNMVANGKVSKVAVIDDTSPNAAAFTPGLSSEKPAALVAYDPAEFSHEEALSGHWTSLFGFTVEGMEHAVPIPDSSLTNLPKPADAVDVSGDETAPDPPPITGVLGAIHETPDKLPVRSITDAGLEIFAQRDETDAGTGLEFAFGDAEYIEDMQVRAQMARDSETNNRFVEFHFRMPEDRAEVTSDILLTASKDVTYGKWVDLDNSLASDLKKGDVISVRKSVMSDQLKPSNGNVPNVRLVADPVHIGEDGKGIPIYRLTLASSDGTTGAMDVQERSMPSIRRYEWDAHAIATSTPTSTVKLTDKAVAAGWHDNGIIGFDKDPSLGAISMDETGAKIFSGKSIKGGAGSGASSTAEMGRRIERKFADGSYVRMNAVPSSVSGTSAGKGSSYGEIRRWNESGMVTIRVPEAVAENPDEFQAAVSRAMEAVGIPPEAQGPATDEQIARFALGKLYKTHSPQFSHREGGVQELSPNDVGMVKVFDRLNKDLEATLGRKVTIDDLEIHLLEDGRFVPMLSKEVAKAITAKQGNLWYRHRLYGGGDATTVAEILSSPNRGLMGAAERFSVGIYAGGQSKESDMSSGAGSRVYLSGKTYSAKTDDEGVFMFAGDLINQSLDIYTSATTGDSWGYRPVNNSFLTQGGMFEYMQKQKLDPRQVAYIFVSASQRQDILAKLKAKGITEIGGRSVEEIIRSSDIPFNMNDDAFQNIGMTEAGNIVKVTDLLPPEVKAQLPTIAVSGEAGAAV
jgi:hypothetical protein